MELNRIYNMDCLEGIKKISDKSINLICTDPPYHLGLTHNGKKGTFNDLNIAKPFFTQLLKEFKRVLTDDGCMHMFTDWRSFAFYRKYKNALDRLYEAAEVFMKGWSSAGVLNSDVIRNSLRIILDQVDNDKIVGFADLLYEGICSDEVLYKRYIISNTTMIAEDVQGIKSDTKATHNKLDKLQEDIKGITDKIEKDKENQAQTVSSTEKFSNNKKQEYIDKWNGRLFLHQGIDDRPLTLANTFIAPQFSFQSYKNDIYVKKEILGEIDVENNLDNLLLNSINYKSRLVILLAGDPGIGKTSIVSWIADKYLKNKNLIILKFRDWDIEDLNNGILTAIKELLFCKKKELENKILILDGFDELKNINDRYKLLNGFINDINDIRNIKVLITSRPGYIRNSNFDLILELKPFDNEKIVLFYEKITGNKINGSYIFNSEVLGIPVILYMAIVSQVDIRLGGSKAELYNKIFALEGGIFDKFTSKTRDGYDYGSHILRKEENKLLFLKFLQNIAFTMLRKNKLSLLDSEYYMPELEFQNKKIQIIDFPVRNLFEKGLTLEFVHKSIYEYFVSEYIYMLI